MHSYVHPLSTLSWGYVRKEENNLKTTPIFIAALKAASPKAPRWWHPGEQAPNPSAEGEVGALGGMLRIDVDFPFIAFLFFLFFFIFGTGTLLSSISPPLTRFKHSRSLPKTHLAGGTRRRSKARERRCFGVAFSFFNGKRAQVPGRGHPQPPAASMGSTEHLSQAGSRRAPGAVPPPGLAPPVQAALTPNSKSHQQAPKPLQREVQSSHPAFWGPGM